MAGVNCGDHVVGLYTLVYIFTSMSMLYIYMNNHIISILKT